MKNFKVIAVWAAVFPLGASCSSGSGQSTVPDARQAPADAAVGPDTRPDMALAAVDAGRDLAADDVAVDAVVNGPEAGPETQIDTKDAFVPDLPIFNPRPGHYSARLDPDLSNPGDSISRLGSYGFTVTVDANGQFMMETTYDGWAKYSFAVVNGSIDYKHGQGWDGYGGTNCPTDGFGIVGSFVSPTEARGLYKGLAWRCGETSFGHFIATLDPQPDSGTAIDVMPIDIQALDITSQ